jgi:DNA-binding response OmpR family regulator
LEKKYNIYESDRLFICAYSSEVSLVVEKKCLECGMDDIVPKPMKKEALERMLTEHDRRKR